MTRMNTDTRHGWKGFAAALAVGSFFFCAVPCLALAAAAEGDKPAAAGKYPAFGLSKDQNVLDHGAKVYRTYCVGCHGVNGDGNGPAARFLNPRPRNFQLAQFRFSSRASGDLPTDEDLFRTVTEGLRGTSMPAWPLLPEEDRRAVVVYIKTFAKEAWANASPSVPTAISDDPYYGQDKTEAIKLGELAYHGMAQCYSCHPAYADLAKINEGRAKYGMSPLDELRENAYQSRAIPNEDGTTITPPDFTWNKLKRGTDERTLYHVVANGITGTPMPTWKGILSEEDLWGIVYYVQSLTKERPHRVTDADLAERHDRIARMEKENKQLTEKLKAAAEEKARQEAAATPQTGQAAESAAPATSSTKA